MIAIQIGSNRGYDDFTNLINNENIEKLILIEPLKVHNESLNQCYSHIENKFIENVIITDNPNSGKSKIYYHKQDGLEYGNHYELASMNSAHTLNIRSYYKEEELVVENIISYTITEIFQKYNINKIDLLFIDTEGFDEKIIKSIDFDKYIINEIYYENLHVNLNDLRMFLESKNYKIIPNVLMYGWSDKAILI